MVVVVVVVVVAVAVAVAIVIVVVFGNPLTIYKSRLGPPGLK